MHDVKLANGTSIPPIGFGLWLMKDKAECVTAVQAALKVGYRHFDTAQRYENEAFLGETLARSGIEREQLFITTKIAIENMRWPVLIPSFEQSLKYLQTDYVDLLLLHFPATEWRRPAWRRIEELAKTKQVRAVGVSNYTITHLEELLHETNVKPLVNQVELHVYLQQPELLEFCRKHDIVVEAYSPLAHGHGIDNIVLRRVAKKYGKTPAQVMLRWCIEVGTVPLPKSTHPDRIKENFEIFDFKLDKDDMAELVKLESGIRTAWDPTHVA